MKSNTTHSSAKHYVEHLASNGRYHFTSQEAAASIDGSKNAVKLALSRLRKSGHIASPVRGFYVIIPPEYRSLGCLPADQFIPALMNNSNTAYYAALLSAAQYYGAAHQRPQRFQVFLGKNRKPIECGKVRVSFIARKNIKQVPTKIFNTPRGHLLVSTPEATAIDLVGYPEHAGGLDGVATVLAELADEIDPVNLADVATSAPLTWSQRLGYLLELLGFDAKAALLRGYVQKEAHEFTRLFPGKDSAEQERIKDWKLTVNGKINIDQ